MKDCWVPCYANPVYRFITGRGELASQSGAFTLYEYLVNATEADYPLVIRGHASFSREDLLSFAANNLMSETGGTFPEIEHARNMGILPSVSDEQIAQLAMMLHGIWDSAWANRLPAPGVKLVVASKIPL